VAGSGAESPLERAALDASDRVVGESRGRWSLRLGGRLAGRALGALLLAAGIAKALDPMRFAQEIGDYHIVTNVVLTGLLAYAIVIVECGVGTALLVNLRPRISLALAGLLLLVFLGAVGYAWSTGSTQECGCFGPWKPRSPAQAFVEDLLFLAVIPWAWWGRRYTQAPTNTLKLAMVGLGIAAGIMIPAVAGMAGGPGSAGVVGSETFKTLEIRDVQVNLATGEHLVFLMSTKCAHCQAAVPEVNALVEDERLPKLVAIAMEDRVERGLFRQDYGAQYPIGEISQQALATLLKKEFPRTFLVRDGRIAAVWDGKVPTSDEVIAAQAATR
jgi:uncharacterized membrane protein YphA (DoxX/SURF4 family)